MNNFFGLYKNEMIKLSHKISTLVILALMILSTVAFGFLLKISNNIDNERSYYNNSRDVIDLSEWRIDSLRESQSYVKEHLAQLKEELKKGTTDEYMGYDIKREIARLETNIEMCDIAIEINIDPYESDWISNVLQNYGYTKTDSSYYNAFPVDELTDLDKESIEEKKKLMERSLSILQKYATDKRSAYLDYLSDSDENYKKEYADDEELLKIYLDENEMRRQYNPDGLPNSTLNFYAITITNDKVSLHNNINDHAYPPKPFTPKERAKSENNIAIHEHLLKTGKYLDVDANTYLNSTRILTNLIGLSSFFVSILMIMLAGSTISSEISTGSIKSLIISPLKRYKIYTAKILSLVSFGAISIFVMFLTVYITNSMLFGDMPKATYTGAVGGVAYELGHTAFVFQLVLVKGIDIFVFMFLALMLSTITRNTAISVGSTVACLFGGMILNSSQMLYFVSGEWRKFVPFANLYLQDKFFPFMHIADGWYDDSLEPITSLPFSLVYLGVAIFCLLFTGYESFNKRDIK